MSWVPLLVNLVVTAAVVAVLMLVTFFYAMRTRVHAIMDTIWPLGFVIIAAVSFLLSAGQGAAGRRVLVLVLTAIWGLRLGAHIFARNFGQGEDKRYASLLRRNTGSPAKFVLLHIYWAQGRVMWFVSLPLQVAMYSHASLSWVGWLGAAVWAVGFGFETVGDEQLRRFRADPAHAGRVLDRGLWRYTRHPNYFGDAMVWFGLWLLACSNWLGVLTVVAPVYMTNMLVRHTGKKLLEKHMARSKGAAYARLRQPHERLRPASPAFPAFPAFPARAGALGHWRRLVTTRTLGTLARCSRSTRSSGLGTGTGTRSSRPGCGPPSGRGRLGWSSTLPNRCRWSAGPIRVFPSHEWQVLDIFRGGFWFRGEF